MMSNDAVISSLKEKIDDLNQQAWESRVNDSQKAFELSQESVKLARSIHYPKGLAEGLRSLGFAYVRLFKNDEAAPLLRESLSLFQSINDLKGQAVVYEYLGIIERNWGNLGQSLGLLLKGNDLIRQLGSHDEIETTSNYQIGVTYKHLGNHENALDYLYKALSIAKKTSFTLMEAYATNIIGSIYFDNGNYEHALELYQQGLVIRRQSNDKWGEAGSLDNIGITYLKLNQFDKAIDHCKQSLAICKDTGDKKGEANASLHLAEIYGQAGDSKQASKFSNESLEIRKARGDKRGEAEVLLFLADLHMNRKDAEDQQIFEWITGALNLAEEIKAQDLLSKAFYHLYQYYEQKGEYKRSLAQLEAHLKIEKEHHKNLINQKVSNLEITHKAETISQRNKELTELNERIERANAELKVEASLERIRAVSMSMNRPDDILNICKVMFTELQALGFKDIRNALINFWDDDHGLLHDYDYSDFSGGNFAKLSYSSHPVFEEFQKKVKQATDAFAELVISEDELETWKQRRRDSGEYEDPRLENISALYYYFYSTGVGALGISTFSPISKENLDVLKRFRNVFDLTYRRYLDIVKAEAQAREAQIQLALERVRARTMAMHHSDELTEVVKMLYQEFDKLKINNESTDIEIGLIDEETGIAKVWAHFYLSDGTISTFDFPFTHFEEINEEFEKWKATSVEKRNELFITTEFSEKQWQRFMNIAEELPDLAEIFRPLIEAKIEKWVTHNAYFSHGMLTLQGTEAYSKETQEIQKRFAKVFEQTYTRFLDLKKAEAQAKEGQIELALERVRARTMAMQKSEELKEVIGVVYDQFIHLNILVEHAGFIIDYKEKDDMNIWLADQHEVPSQVTIPYFDSPHWNSFIEAKEKGKDFFANYLSFEEKNKFYQELFKLFPVPEAAKDYYFSCPGLAISTVLLENVGLYIENFSGIPYTDEENNTLMRFGRVFQQTYTRFLDLQKAEAQVREAQIETGLERVRSKTMAMHKSEEVTGVAVSLNEELLKLGFEGGSTIIIIDKETGDTDQWTGFSEDKSIKSCYVPYFKHPYHDALVNAWKSGENFLVYTVKGDEKKPLDDHYFSTGYKIFPESDKKWMREMPSVTFSHAFMKYGAIHWGPGQLTEEQSRILQRFAKVFEQSYTRFLDLQKAEAQAREAQIQLALERVRASTMAMHKSDELPASANLLFHQVHSLGIPAFAAGYCIWDEDKQAITLWMSSEGVLQPPFKAPTTEDELFIQMRKGYEDGKTLHVVEMGGEELVAHYQYMRTLPIVGDIFNSIHEAGHPLPAFQVMHYAYFSKGFLLIITYEPVPNTHDIFKRFAKVFEQTYTRFLDLQRAEAQTREAQIEAALERVRSRSMAMHKSDELLEVVASVFQQMQFLGFNLNLCNIVLFDNKTLEADYWVSGSEQAVLPESYHIPYFDHPLYQYQLNTWKNSDPFAVFELKGETKRTWDEILFTKTDVKRLPDSMKKTMQQLDKVIISSVATKHGLVQAIGTEQLLVDDVSILNRFAKVFEQTYTRFLDLQKAEAQTREAQIEVAVERVRAKALAMHKSEDLHSVVVTLKKELMGLQIPDITAATIYLEQEDGLIRVLDLSDTGADDDEKPQLKLDKVFRLEDTDPDLWIRKMWERNENYFVLEADENDFVRAVQFIRTVDPAGAEIAEKIIREKSIKKAWLPTVKLEKGVINIDLLAPPAREIENILLKMGAGFDLAYKRFLDLQKAEAQAREAQIELGLERVRARAMAMQRSIELKELIATVSSELSKLDFVLDRCFINVIDPQSLGMTWWMANPETSSDPTGLYIKYHDHIPYLAHLEAWKERKVRWVYVLEGDIKKTWDEFLFIETDLAKLPQLVIDYMRSREKVYLSSSFNNFGYLSLATLEPLTDEQFDIMLRFAKVFDLTYTRFNDLQKAEAQAREALIEAALERVRARALAMQDPEELKDVAMVLRTEMGLLGVEELETCSIYINDEVTNKTECWYALKDQRAEKKLVSDHFPLNLDDTWVGREMKNFYKADAKQVSIIMQGANRKEWINYCEERSIPFRGYYGEVIPDRTYHLYKFSHGAIGAAAAGDISAESWKLLSRAASVFSLAYSRFKDLTQARLDLQKLKEEKQRAESALSDLQNTQKQLVQAEKMASLGELTAGIAHEIQNPLNFVNNFSDVSNELLDEMVEEVDKGNYETVKEIAEDIKQNLQKINHHGKRADGIVKGMLQHSRSSSGQKEPTDINALTDEYLRLAYHGLRAKDKSFNAKFETDFDNSIQKINVMAQDIGRVILNMINNAFYAVNEKKKQNINGYEPMVTISSKKEKDKVRIMVKDNGNGIPPKVLDKIFQPFFTTKPTGQGTGLGLSLAYDIIKAHDGEIVVNTKEGEGSEFIISLPSVN